MSAFSDVERFTRPSETRQTRRDPGASRAQTDRLRGRTTLPGRVGKKGERGGGGERDRERDIGA